MNMNMNVNVKTNFPTKHVFSKSSVMTLGISLIVLAGGILGRAVCAMIFSQRLSVLNSLYRIFGTGSVPIVNIIIGVLTAFILIFLAIGLFSARSGALSEPPVTSGLSFLKTGLIAALIYSSLAVVASFASVSVINYTDIEGYNGIINFSATGLFWLTFFLGIAVLCCEIALIRMSGAMTANLNDGSLVKKGAGLAFFAGIIGTFTSAVAFCIKLYQLVTPPKNYIQNISADKATVSLSSAEMILNCFNVIIFAALIVVFITTVMMAASYAVASDDIIRNARSSYYNAGHSVINPENLQDYANSRNYNYNQSPNFTPYYQGNKTYQSVYKNIYTRETPPVPQAPENPFIPKTQYPPVNPNYINSPNPVYNTAPDSPANPQYNAANTVPTAPTAPTAPDLSKDNTPPLNNP